MNLSQKQDILNLIESFERTGFETAFANKYRDTATVDSVSAADYSVAELFALSRKAINQLKNRLYSADWQVLPFSQNLNEYGIVSINNVITNITNHLINCNYNHAAASIKALVYYEMLNDFWSIPKKIDLGVRESSLSKLEQRAALMMTHAEERQKKINDLIGEVEKIKEALTTFKAEKDAEFNALKQNQAESNTLLSEIKNLKNQVDNTHSTINSINAQCDTVLKKLREELESVDKQQKEINKQNEEIDATNKRLSSEVASESAKVKEAFETVTQHKDEVAKMMGYIADGTLSHSFNHRKQEVTKSIRWWGLWTILSLVALIAWIFIVFTFFSAHTSNEWVNVIINSVKSSPLAFVFGYALAQLSKERLIKEEYAYREAVALTLTAYLEQLDDENNTDRKNLLLQTVEKLYTKPLVTKSETLSPIKIKSKDFIDVMTNLTEAIKTIKK
jgi:methyl-accepting chemotaxis protein